MRVPGEAVVAAGEDADTALAHPTHRIDGNLQLLHETARADHLGCEAPVAAGVAGLVREAERRHDEAPVAVGLEQVQRFLVGEVGVIDDAEAVPDTHLDRVRAAGVGAHAHARGPCDLHRRCDLGVGHHGTVGPAVRRTGVARDVELEEIGPLADEEATDLSHFVGPVGDPRERRRLDVGQMQLVLVAEPAGDGDLRPVGEIARARDAPGVDLVADHDVEARLGRGARQHARVGAVEHRLGDAHRDQDVLFRRQAREGRVRRRVGIADVAVGLDEAGHQRRAGAVDHPRLVARQAAAALNRDDALALDQHVCRKRRGATAVENRGAGDQRAVHRALPERSHNSTTARPPAPPRRGRR